jgi:hypothetical protein
MGALRQAASLLEPPPAEEAAQRRIRTESGIWSSDHRLFNEWAEETVAEYMEWVAAIAEAQAKRKKKKRRKKKKKRMRTMTRRMTMTMMMNKGFVHDRFTWNSIECLR